MAAVREQGPQEKVKSGILPEASLIFWPLARPTAEDASGKMAVFPKQSPQEKAKLAVLPEASGKGEAGRQQ